ncbi:cryptococcal mannosyltransferase 1-domain-containing protein [Gorgonomyces haynaldii]|nr:cryptococcal mannosyltransferase 1-domain-containing protein [Gorgonomyces haynaldii]
MKRRRQSLLLLFLLGALYFIPETDTELCSNDYSKYTYLQHLNTTFLIALNLYNNEQVFPLLSSQIDSLIEFLGRDRFYVSVYENGSRDNTQLLLSDWRKTLDTRGVRNRIVTDPLDTDYQKLNRIQVLAEIRNKALKPLEQHHFDMVLFMNDVYHCLDDTLELIHQQHSQKSDITCGFDYTFQFPTGLTVFYDTWVARTLSGHPITFNDIFPTFTYDPEARWRYLNGLPLQAYSCWNGMALLNAEPFYQNVRFRTGTDCMGSECQQLADDFWSLGYNRVLMVPQVKVVYKPNEWQHIRRYKRKVQIRASRHTANTSLSLPTSQPQRWKGWSLFQSWQPDLPVGERVNWTFPGPEKVLCVPLIGEGVRGVDFTDYFWYPVNNSATRPSHKQTSQDQ